ncbi:MAG: pyridoxamine kinase [Clostridia bacterium]|nr:pyridoxamine kinase [Clostridia bacterium]
MYQPRILTIQDISCFGKCSLTVALPIISAMGVETVILPTAVLSTHTGGFKNFTFRDLTEDIKPVTDHWKAENIDFNGIYTGYLGSFEQLRLVGEIFDSFGGFKLVDPVMADNGKLYTGFTPEFALGMAKLCSKADYIVPNITEASFMLGREYPGVCTPAIARDFLPRLLELGCGTAVLTGVVENDRQGVVAYDGRDYTEYYSDNLDAKFHGTGDVWASAFCGAVALKKDLYTSLRIAVDFTVSCIRRSIGDDEHRYGVRFEESIGELAGMVSAGPSGRNKKEKAKYRFL